MKQNWTYEPRQDAYLFGTDKDGAGVFVDDTIPESNNEGCWTGNVITPDDGQLLGHFFSKEDAMEEAERVWEKMHNDN